MRRRQDHLRSLQESIRRYTKIKTYYGIIPVPVGNTSTIVFPLNRAKDRYGLLGAQTNSLEGKIDFEEVKSVTEVVLNVYKEGSCLRSFLYLYTSTFSYWMILISFLFLLGLFLTLIRAVDMFALYVVAGYVFIFIVLYFLHLFSKYLFTQSLRRCFRKAELFLKQVNYELRHQSLVFKLGKNLLWIELHVLDIGEDQSHIGGIEVNLSFPPTNPATLANFKPSFEAFSQPPTDSIFDEKAALKNIENHNNKEQTSMRDKKPDEPLENYNEEDVKML